MPITIPSTVNVTVGTLDLNQNGQSIHYQQFVATAPDGTPLGSVSSPLPASIVVSGYYHSGVNASSTVLPVGGAYYEDTLTNSVTELQNSELSISRLTVRGSLKTAGDGRINELVGSSSSGYDDIYVASGYYQASNLNPLDANGYFFTLSDVNSRHFYIPMIRSGWRSLSFSILSPVDGTVSVFADMGSLTRDILISSFSINSSVRYGVTAAPSASISGSLIGLPALAYPVNGFILTFDPATTSAGFYEIHITRGA